jgi:hypothetical protein
MEKPNLTITQQVAEAAATFEKQRTGQAPQAVTLVLGNETLVITPAGSWPNRRLAPPGTCPRRPSP